MGLKQGYDGQVCNQLSIEVYLKTQIKGFPAQIVMQAAVYVNYLPVTH